MTSSSADAPTPADALADHVTALSQDAAALARAELQAARQDLAASARRVLESAALLGAAAGCGALALGASGVFAVRLLDTLLPRTLSALVAAAGFGAAAVSLGTRGVEQVRAAAQAPVG
jgi:hypothetical protein